MAVVPVKRQQVVVQLNIKPKQMMMMMMMENLFILNQVHVLGGKNDVKQ
jgi:hypothetical protein